MSDRSSQSADKMPARVANPFAPLQQQAETPEGAAAGALGKREIADAQAARIIARQYPRDPVKAMDRIINSFSRPSLAEEAEYQYTRGGQDVSGLSIRAAEELARQWGNITAGVAELARYAGMSECLAWAEDLETGYREEKRFFVRHWRDTKSGGYRVTDERDIYEVIANHGARRKRACILAIIPIDVQETAQRQAQLTLKQKSEVTEESIKKLLETFAQFGVTKEHIEKRLQRRIESMTPAQLVTMRRIYNSLRDGMSTAADWFEIEQPAQKPSEENASATARAKSALIGGNGKNGAPKVEHPAEQQSPVEQHPGDASEWQDLGGAIPQYDEQSAIAELKKAKTLKELEDARTRIWKDFADTNRPLPLPVEATYHDRHEAFQQQKKR